MSSIRNVSSKQVDLKKLRHHNDKGKKRENENEKMGMEGRREALSKSNIGSGSAFETKGAANRRDLEPDDLETPLELDLGVRWSKGKSVQKFSKSSSEDFQYQELENEELEEEEGGNISSPSSRSRIKVLGSMNPSRFASQRNASNTLRPGPLPDHRDIRVKGQRSLEEALRKRAAARKSLDSDLETQESEEDSDTAGTRGWDVHPQSNSSTLRQYNQQSPYHESGQEWPSKRKPVSRNSTYSRKSSNKALHLDRKGKGADIKTPRKATLDLKQQRSKFVEYFKHPNRRGKNENVFNNSDQRQLTFGQRIEESVNRSKDAFPTSGRFSGIGDVIADYTVRIHPLSR